MIFTKKASIKLRKIVVAGTLVFGLTVFTVTKSSFAKTLLDNDESSSEAVSNGYKVSNKESVALVKVDNTKPTPEQPKTDEVPTVPSGAVEVKSTSYGTLPQTSDEVSQILPIIGATMVIGSFGLFVTKRKYNLL